MRELVELLRQARQEKQITLDEISNRTKIRKHYLEALERGDLSVFAGEVYLKGAIRNYAETVGLDPNDVLAVYHRIQGSDFPEHQDAPPPARPSSYRMEGPKLSYSGAIVLCVLALLVGAIWWGVSFLRQSPAAEPGNTAENGLHDNQGDQEPAPIVAEPGPQAEVELASRTDRETAYYVRGASEIEIKLIFSEPCWIQLMVDGVEPFFPRTFQRGDEWTEAALQKMWIRIGNPRGAALFVNGVEIEGLQQHRQPHNFSFILE